MKLKVTEAQKAEIRRLVVPDEFGVHLTLDEIGQRYGICREYVRQIAGNVGRHHPSKRLRRDLEQLRENLYRNKSTTIEEIAEQYGVSVTLAKRIVCSQYRYELSIGLRECRFCKEWLPLDAFYRLGSGNLQIMCKACSNAKVCEYQRTHKEHVNELARKRNKTEKYRAYRRAHYQRKKEQA